MSDVGFASLGPVQTRGHASSSGHRISGHLGSAFEGAERWDVLIRRSGVEFSRGVAERGGADRRITRSVAVSVFTYGTSIIKCARRSRS